MFCPQTTKHPIEIDAGAPVLGFCMGILVVIFCMLGEGNHVITYPDRTRKNWTSATPTHHPTLRQNHPKIDVQQGKNWPSATPTHHSILCRSRPTIGHATTKKLTLQHHPILCRNRPTIGHATTKKLTPRHTQTPPDSAPKPSQNWATKNV